MNDLKNEIAKIENLFSDKKEEKRREE